MKRPAEIVAELHRIRLYDFVATVVAKHVPHMTVEELCKSTRQQPIARVRQIVWARLAELLENQSAVARLFGVDHSTILYACETYPPAIVSVLLAKFETTDLLLELVYERHHDQPAFGVLRARREVQSNWRVTWFGTDYHLAREVFAKACEDAGQPTFRSAAAASGGAS